MKYRPIGLDQLPNWVINRNSRVIIHYIRAINLTNKEKLQNKRVISHTSMIYLSIIPAKYYSDRIVNNPIYRIDDPTHYHDDLINWIDDPIFYYDNPIPFSIDPIYMNDKPICSIADLIRLDNDLIYVCDNPICIVNDLIFRCIDLIPGNTRGQSLNRHFQL